MIILLWLVSCASAKVVLGVDPAKFDLYRKDVLYCPGNPSKKLTLDMINDNFCDCPEDGFDEPGTSACSEATFYCKNEGHFPKVLKSMFVNDGVCDCCDGSDESGNPHVKCPNTCQQLRLEEEKLAAEKARNQKLALEKKADLIERAKKIRVEVDKRMADLTLELQIAQNQLDTLKMAHEMQKDNIKATGNENSEYENFCTQLQLKFDSVREIFKDMKESTCDACEEAVNRFEKLDSQESDSLNSQSPLVNELLNDENSEEKKKTIWETIKNLEFRDIKNLFKYYRATKTVTVYLPAQPTSHENPPNPFADADSKVYQAKLKLEEYKKKYEKDFGPQDVFLPMVDQCIELKHQKYSYKLCFFDKITQKEDKEWSHDVSLGKWNDWAPPEEGAADSYRSMIYDQGQYCWQGPKRNTKVLLECGPEDKIITVEEPSTCQYLMQVMTPAAC